VNMFYTYAHIKKDTKEIFYIGKGNERRLTRKDARNKHWHNTVAKHGFLPIILAKWETEKEAFEHEKFLIKCFKDLQIKLVNQSSGGDGNNAAGGLTFKNKKHSDLAKEKCRIANLGKKRSEESKRKNAEKHKKPIQINGIIYASWQDASKETGIPTGSLSYLLAGKISKKSKYNWINQISLVM
jgi:hypothetical protein